MARHALSASFLDRSLLSIKVFLITDKKNDISNISVLPVGPGKFSLPLKNFGVLKSLAPSMFSWPAKSPGTGQVLPQASPNSKSIHSPPLVSLSLCFSLPLVSSRAAANPSLAAAKARAAGAVPPRGQEASSQGRGRSTTAP